MALGTPVVSTAIMGTHDLLREGEGAVIVEEDESAFTMAVADLLPGLDGPSCLPSRVAKRVVDLLAAFQTTLGDAKMGQFSPW